MPRREQDLDQLPVTSVDGASTTLAGLLDETYTDGFIILKDGIVVYERYFNSMTPRTLHLLQSVAKSVTAAAAGVLVGSPPALHVQLPKYALSRQDSIGTRNAALSDPTPPDGLLSPHSSMNCW